MRWKALKKKLCNFDWLSLSRRQFHRVSVSFMLRHSGPDGFHQVQSMRQRVDWQFLLCGLISKHFLFFSWLWCRISDQCRETGTSLDASCILWVMNLKNYLGVYGAMFELVLVLWSSHTNIEESRSVHISVWLSKLQADWRQIWRNALQQPYNVICFLISVRWLLEVE